ncbi:hypothetical protein BKA69DRAFT_1121754 [Paraphysoderma sedebokerense]|nr:hypothetical protein BKA69DRAFT_1121754 [Paraphysoderma sedebokerense]
MELPEDFSTTSPTFSTVGNVTIPPSILDNLSHSSGTIALDTVISKKPRQRTQKPRKPKVIGEAKDNATEKPKRKYVRKKKSIDVRPTAGVDDEASDNGVQQQPQNFQQNRPVSQPPFNNSYNNLLSHLNQGNSNAAFNPFINNGWAYSKTSMPQNGSPSQPPIPMSQFGYHPNNMNGRYSSFQGQNQLIATSGGYSSNQFTPQQQQIYQQKYPVVGSYNNPSSPSRSVDARYTYNGQLTSPVSPTTPLSNQQQFPPNTIFPVEELYTSNIIRVTRRQSVNVTRDTKSHSSYIPFSHRSIRRYQPYPVTSKFCLEAEIERLIVENHAPPHEHAVPSAFSENVPISHETAWLDGCFHVWTDEADFNPDKLIAVATRYNMVDMEMIMKDHYNFVERCAETQPRAGGC